MIWICVVVDWERTLIRIHLMKTYWGYSKSSWSFNWSAGSRVHAVPLLSIVPPFPLDATLIHPLTTPRHKLARGVTDNCFCPINGMSPRWSVVFDWLRPSFSLQWTYTGFVIDGSSKTHSDCTLDGFCHICNMTVVVNIVLSHLDDLSIVSSVKCRQVLVPFNHFFLFIGQP